MNRRFVNLVTASYNSRMYSLRRLDVAKHLFYPSIAEAEAAANEDRDSNGSGKPPKIENLRRLPPPRLRLRSYRDDSCDSFSLLSPDGGRILHTNKHGHAILCDVESRSTKTLPSLAEPNGCGPISFAVPDGNGPGEEILYVMRSAPITTCRNNFEALHLGSGKTVRLPGPRPLPPPPFAAFTESPWILSSTLLDGGRIICVSARLQEGAAATYCFDTETREWWRAGEWLLPFDGRAVHVPELDTWVGFAPRYPHRLCAADLSAVAAMATPPTTSQLEAPTLAHVWEDFNQLPPEKRVTRYKTRNWELMERHLVSLGSGRFCVARTCLVEETVSGSSLYGCDPLPEPMGEFAVLTGIEVVCGAGERGGLRMVKHKSKRYMFTDDCSIKWAL